MFPTIQIERFALMSALATIVLGFILAIIGLFRAATAYGVVVHTPDKSYRLGVPFDQQTPDGLRTIYPLTPLEPGEVIRRSVHYELPRLRER